MTTRYPSGNRSSHYYVDKAGAVTRLVKDEDRAWHAGVSAIGGKRDVNDFSLGVELENLGDGKDPFPEPQLRAANELVSQLMATYAIPRDRVVRHRDIALPPGRKTDPADNLDWQAFLGALRPPRVPQAGAAPTSAEEDGAVRKSYRAVGGETVFSTDRREEAITFACGLVVRGERSVGLYEPGESAPWHIYSPREIAGLLSANHDVR